MSFENKLGLYLRRLPPDQRLDLGCALQQGAFEFTSSSLQFSLPKQSLIFFFLRLLDRLRAMGNVPAADLAEYGRCLTN